MTLNLIGSAHSINNLILQIPSNLNNLPSPAPAPAPGELNVAGALQGALTGNPLGSGLYKFLFVVANAVAYLIDPTGGTDFTFTEDPGAPNLASITLPTMDNVASYNVRYYQSGVWSGYQSIQPNVVDNLPLGVSAVEFNAIGSSGQGEPLPSFLFQGSFASAGTVSATLAETTVPSVWASAVSGNWGDSTMWIGGVVPNAIGATVVLDQPTKSQCVVTVNGPETVGALLLGNSASTSVGYTLKGSGATNTLTFNNLGNGATITVLGGKQVITAPVVLADNLLVSGNGTAWTLVFGTASSITDNGAGYSLTMNGIGGELILSGSNSYSGGTTVSAGSLAVDGQLINSSVTVQGGTLLGSGQVNSNVTLSSGTVAGTLAIGGSLTVTGNSTWLGGTVSCGAAVQSGTFTLASGAVLTTPVLNVSGGAIAAASATGTLNGSLNYTSSTSSTFGGAIAGHGSTLTLNNALATLAVSGSNTYSGATTVSAGVLCAAAPNTLSPNSAVTITGGTLDARNSPQSTCALTVGASGSLNLSIGNLLSCTNPANLDGRLNLFGTATTGFVELLSYPSFSGSFSNTSLNNGSVPAGYALQYNPTQVDLVSNALVPSGSSPVWSNPSNWPSHGPSNGVGQPAALNTPTTAAVTITLDEPVTLGTLLVGNSGSTSAGYALQGNGSNTLTFNNSDNGAAIAVTDGTHGIDAAVVLADNLVVTTGSTNPWTFICGTASSITDNGAGYSLTMSGSGGALILSGSDCYHGGTIVTAGTLIVTDPNAIPDGTSLTVGADAALLFDPSQAASSVAVSPGAAAVPEPSTVALLGVGVVAVVGYRLRRRLARRTAKPAFD